ncbi:hypothetical protein PCE1_001785 [Barthelona sp. PCE]
MSFPELIDAAIDSILNLVPGLTALLIDNHTSDLLTSYMPLSELLSKSVCLTHNISNEIESSKMTNTPCVVLIKPCIDSVRQLASHLKNPIFRSYTIVFCNKVARNLLEMLATLDVKKSIIGVHEFFLDFMLYNSNTFHLGVKGTFFTKKTLNQLVEKLHTVFSTLLLKPTIFFQKHTVCAPVFGRSLINSFSDTLTRDLVHGPRLVIVDRVFDMVCPLLIPWSYEGLIHHLWGINKHRTTVGGLTHILRDDFFLENATVNFGELNRVMCSRISTMKSRENEIKQLNSEVATTGETDALKQIFLDVDDLNEQSNRIAHHAVIVSELNKEVESKKYLEFSNVQQSLLLELMASKELHETVCRLLENPFVSPYEKLSLIGLYVASDSADNAYILEFRDLFISIHPLLENVCNVLIDKMRQSKEARGFLSRISRRFESFDNILTAYTPKIVGVVEEIIQNKTPSAFSLTGTQHKWNNSVVVFFIGGVTMLEIEALSALKEKYPDVDVMVGSNEILNMEGFLNNIMDSL